MAFIQTIVLALLSFSFFIGQIFRFDLFGFSFPLIDISIIIFCFYNLFSHYQNKTLKNQNTPLSLFLIYSWCLLGVTLIYYHIDSLKPLFYLLRLTCLLSLFLFPPEINSKNKNIFYLSIIANIIFGLIQYFVWPNFTYFDVNHWDPHLYRLVSSFFDPTFTGLIYLFFLIKIFLDKKIPYRWLLLIITYITLALTYSRSTYLSLIFAFAFISFRSKKISILLVSLLLVGSTIFLLPRQPGEGTKLERTSSIAAKIENYQEGFHLFTKSPVFGVGYNNLPFVRQINNKSSHANGGFDGSLLTILVTTGIIGGTLFILGFKKIFSRASIIVQSCFIALFVHSIFANSLLYPWILLFLALI